MQAGPGVCYTHGPVGYLIPASGRLCATWDQRPRLWGPAGILRSFVDTLLHGGLGHLVQRQHWGPDLQKGAWLGNEQRRGQFSPVREPEDAAAQNTQQPFIGSGPLEDAVTADMKEKNLRRKQVTRPKRMLARLQLFSAFFFSPTEERQRTLVRFVCLS